MIGEEELTDAGIADILFLSYSIFDIRYSIFYLVFASLSSTK